MAFDEGTAHRIQQILEDKGILGVDELRMFGGLCFTVRGHMLVGPHEDRLMVRVGKENQAEALAQPHAREMDFTGRPMAAMVWVDPPGYASDEDLEAWLDRALAFNATLPTKVKKPKKKKTPAKKAPAKKTAAKRPAKKTAAKKPEKKTAAKKPAKKTAAKKAPAKKTAAKKPAKKTSAKKPAKKTAAKKPEKRAAINKARAK